jgi:hypothetical protein
MRKFDFRIWFLISGVERAIFFPWVPKILKATDVIRSKRVSLVPSLDLRTASRAVVWLKA